MKILITNDDGIYKKGLWALAAELQKVAEVVVVAPDREQSAISAAITLHHTLQCSEVQPLVTGIKAYSVTGTPSDCVIMALGMMDDIGMVFSGVNEGSNLGNDVLLSGTVGAALQGFFHKLPSVALSIVEEEEMHFESAAIVARSLATQFSNGFSAVGMLLNVNLPNLPINEIQGIEVTKLANAGYNDTVKEEFTRRRKFYRIIRNVPQWNGGEGTDAWTIDKDKISITPLMGEMGVIHPHPTISDLRGSLLQDLGLA